MARSKPAGKGPAKETNALPTRPPPARGRSKLPVSGSEVPYTTLTYGTPWGVGNNNCYAYALGRYAREGGTKLQPGNVARVGGEVDLTRCDSVVQRALRDLRGAGYAAPADAPCRKGYYKTMAFLAKGNDYHWYKQHRDALVSLPRRVPSVARLAAALGVDRAQVYAASPPEPGDTVLVKDANIWSHKQGLATGPLLKDSCGKVIDDPRTACRTYTKKLDYTSFCGAVCVRKNGGSRR